MRLVRADLAELAIESVLSATEWPHYSIFLHLSDYDSIVIAPRTYLHGDLFVMLKQEWKRRGNAEIELQDSGVFDGHIEWDDDGSFVIRTERGDRLPEQLESQMLAFLRVEGA